MPGYIDSTGKSRKLWEELADDWDVKMGDSDNRYHREIIRPATLKLLEPKSGESILDAACGNGNFSRLMARLGVKVTAFDYSEKMIENAKFRCRDYLENIDFRVADATNYDEIMALKKEKPFDKAVSNMAVMDISELSPLFHAVYDLLAPGGIFVFSGVHPCFQTPHMKKIVETNDYTGEVNVKMGIQTYEYIKPCMHEVTALSKNNKRVIHYHRPLSSLLGICFEAGFVMDGIEEPVFEKAEDANEFEWYDIPPSIIIRIRK